MVARTGSKKIYDQYKLKKNSSFGKWKNNETFRVSDQCKIGQRYFKNID